MESASKPEPVEETDEDILKEIEREEQEAERIRLEMISNGSLPNASASAFQTPQEQQLTRFQESIITTGSGVSLFLLAILAILFIVQAIRKAYKAYTTEAALTKVSSVLGEGVGKRAETITPFETDVDPKSYPVYNTPFDARDEYYKKMEQGASTNVLKDLLLQRAVVCIDRFSTIQRDGPGIRKNWELDLLPKQVWDDFNSAQANVQYEISQVIEENEKHNYNWGQYGNDIFARAREMYGEYISRKRDKYHQDLRRKHGMRNPPSPKRFGAGFNPGFLSQDTEKKKSRRQQKKEKKRLAQQQAQNGPVYDGQDRSTSQDQSQMRRRKKGRRRFAKG